MAGKARVSRRAAAPQDSSDGITTSPASSSSSSAASSPASSSASRSYARYIKSAKRSGGSKDLRASMSSTTSTSSNSTRASDASSVASSCRARRNNKNQHNETASRRRAHRETTDERTRLEQQEQQQLMEQDPDYLPIDSTHYKRQVTRTKKKRARRIKLKHYGLAKQAAKLNNLSGFLLHSITPRESSILTYTSMASPGTHTEYDIVVENFRTGMIWQVSRRYSTFRLLRDELVKPFQAPHCHYCASIMRDMQKLEVHFPGKRLWGSTSPSVVRGRAERFQKYLHGLMDIATSGYKLNCRLIANYFVVQLRNFLTSESVRYKGIPGALGQQIPCLLHELAMPRSPNDPMTLQTIQEHSSRSSRGSLFEDVEGFDGKDFREKLRIAEEHDRHYMLNDQACNDPSNTSNQHGFDDYCFREEDEDEYDEDEDDEEDDDEDDDDEDEQQQRHKGRQRKA